MVTEDEIVATLIEEANRLAEELGLEKGRPEIVVP